MRTLSTWLPGAPFLAELPPQGGRGGADVLGGFPVASRIVTDPTAVAAIGAGVLAGLLLLLFLYRRKPYILCWTCSWALMSVSLLLTGRTFGDQPGALALFGVSQVLSVGASLLLVLSARSFRSQGARSSKLLLVLLPLTIWFPLAPLAVGPRSALVFGYLISGGVLGLASVAFLNLVRTFRMIGAGLIGGTLLALSASYLWSAATVVRAPFAIEAPLSLLTINAILYLVEVFGMHLLVAEDMTYELRIANRELSAARDELRALAITDELTGCYNRRYFQQLIERELRRHNRYGLPLSLLFIDIDRFKDVNDRLGHDTGDRVIQQVAQLLSCEVRDVDYVFRWGGDEFVVLLSCNCDHAARKVTEIKAGFARLKVQMGLPDGVALSIGCREAPADLREPSSLVHEADQEMYREKLEGRILVRPERPRESPYASRARRIGNPAGSDPAGARCTG